MSILNLFKRNTKDEVKLPAWVCAADAKARDKANKPAYSQEQQDFANTLHTLVEQAFSRSKVYMNYRKNFIAIKVDAPSLLDKVTLRVATLDSYCEQHNIQRTVSRHGNIVYRLPYEALEQVTQYGLKALA